MMRSVFLAACVGLAMILVVAGQNTKRSNNKPENQAKRCYTRETASAARQTAKVYQPNPNYDPVLGYDPSVGPRTGSPLVDANGRARPVNCVAAEKPKEVGGTLPKFYCSVEGNVDENGKPVRYKIKPHFKGQARDKRDGEVYGEFLSSRFSRAVGFFADDEWVADVTCPDCEKSLTKPFQGAAFDPFQPAAGIELTIGEGIDENCDGKESADLARSLSELSHSQRAQVDALKLWLAFIDHDDTKSQNQRYACLDDSMANGVLACASGQSIFYVSDMGSTFGSSTASEKKATLERWKGKDPIKVSGGRCTATARGIGDASVSEAGRALLAGELQRLLDAEQASGLITRVFKASRNEERDQPAEAWTAEFVRKAKTIINARCR